MIAGFSSTLAASGLNSPWDNIIYSQAGGDPSFMALTKALISRESAWDSQAIRPEPKINDASYGLMQVLLRTARIFAPTMNPDDLLDPITNIVIGTSYLHDLLNRYSDLPSIISSYNAGRPRLDLNQSYVNDVLAYYTWFLQNDPLVQAGAAVPTETPVETVLPPLEVVNTYPDRSEPPPAAPSGGGSGLAIAAGFVVLFLVSLAALSRES